MSEWLKPTGNGTGREVVAYLTAAEEHLERQWWRSHSHRLTPAEAKRIRRGEYQALVRPVDSAPSGWVRVTDRLEVKLDPPELRRGKWRSRITHVRDFRPPSSSSPPGKRTRESLEDVTTLYGAHGSVGEPERMDHDGDATRARLHKAMSAREAIIGRS